MIKYSSFVFAILISVISYGQINNTSPYSYFGIGDFSQQSTVIANSMGGLSLTNNTYNQLNFSNPAGNSALAYTVFSVAGKTNFLQVNDGASKQNASFTSFSYLALGIPLGKKGGMLIGVQPNSNVGYTITEELLDADQNVNVANIFSGTGGTNRFFGSFSYTVSKGLSLGLEGEYIFGKIENSIINQRLGVALNTQHKLISNISGGSLKLGVHYKKEIAKGLELKAGLTTKLKNSLNADSQEYLYSFSYSATGSERPQDTLVNINDANGKIVRPLAYTAAIGFGKPDNWFAGVEYNGQNALDFSDSVFLTNNKIEYTNTSRLSVGGFWTPKMNSISNYWERITYRGGVVFKSSGLSINPTGSIGDFVPIKDFGMSFGLGLPIGNQLSQVNIGLEFGNRGSSLDGLIKENYFNLRLGLNLVDKWFQKREIN